MQRASGILAVLVLVSACTGSAGETPPSTTPPSGALEPIATDRLLAELELESLIGVVTHLRELEFIRPVQVVILDDADYRRRVDELLAPPTGIDADQADGWLRLLGVMPEGSSVYEATSRLLQYGVAVHDPSTDQVLVRAGAGIDPYVEAVVVHELVHLLQAQHFGAPESGLLTGERSYVYAAIVEGDALRITQRFIGTFGSDDEFRYEQGLAAASEDTTAVRATTPRYVTGRLRRPAEDGVRYLQTLTNEEVDRVLGAVTDDVTDLDITSEALVVAGADLEQLPAAIQPLTVSPYQPLPLDETLGVGPLRLLLEGAVPGELLQDAVAGWGGDVLEVGVYAEDVIFAYAYRGESREDVAEVSAAFRLLLDTQLAGGAYASIRVTDETVLVLAASDPSVAERLDTLYGDFGEEAFVIAPG